MARRTKIGERKAPRRRTITSLVAGASQQSGVSFGSRTAARAAAGEARAGVAANAAARAAVLGGRCLRRAAGRRTGRLAAAAGGGAIAWAAARLAVAGGAAVHAAAAGADLRLGVHRAKPGPRQKSGQRHVEEESRHWLPPDQNCVPVCVSDPIRSAGRRNRLESRARSNTARRTGGREGVERERRTPPAFPPAGVHRRAARRPGGPGRRPPAVGGSGPASAADRSTRCGSSTDGPGGRAGGRCRWSAGRFRAGSNSTAAFPQPAPRTGGQDNRRPDHRSSRSTRREGSGA